MKSRPDCILEQKMKMEKAPLVFEGIKMLIAR